VMRKQLDYVCMQPTRQGQASYAHVNEIIAGLRRLGWDIRLVEPRHPRPGRADGLRRLVFAGSAQFSFWIKFRFRPATFVYIRSHFLSLPTAILARMAGSIVVQEVNGPASDTYDAWPQLRHLHGLLSLVSRAQIRMADAVVVVTPGLEDYVRAHTGRRGGYHVIGNGADVDRFRPAATEGATANGDSPDAAVSATSDVGGRYVVFVGALASWQGIETMLDAVVSQAWPSGVNLIIAGDGRERGRIEAAARRNARIRWLGTIPYDETPALIAGSLAALVPIANDRRSRSGLSPLKLFEAMASGVPVVASDLPGLGDLVRSHGCGITFPAGNADALARSVAELAAHPARSAEMGSRGREAAVKRYSWAARARQTDEVLLELAARRRARLRSTRRRW
jgi:glycosyltransferase involved in cell wall biosynthesis